MESLLVVQAMDVHNQFEIVTMEIRVPLFATHCFHIVLEFTYGSDEFKETSYHIDL